MLTKDNALLVCETCGYPLSGKQKRYCSKACRDTRMADRIFTCETCGTDYRPKHRAQRYCGASCKSKATWAIRRGEKPSLQGGVKQYVNEAIDLTLSGHHRKGLTIDHVIPLARGGSHTLANLKPAHRVCNQRKSSTLPDDV